MLTTMAASGIRIMIPELMKERGWSIRDLADKSGIAYGTANAWAKGRIDRVDLATLESICKALDLTPGDILFYSPENSED